MSHLSNGAIYILILTAIGCYYFIRYYVIKWGYPVVKHVLLAPIMLPIETTQDFFKYCKKIKRIAKFATPTQFFIRIVTDAFTAFAMVVLMMTILIIFTILIILAHLLFYWIFFVDHQLWIHWCSLGYLIWFFVRGAIIIPIVAIAIKHLKRFPKIKYFKDLRHMFYVSFSYTYLAVVLITLGEVVRLAAAGIITTPLYLYYVEWFHLIVGS